MTSEINKTMIIEYGVTWFQQTVITIHCSIKYRTFNNMVWVQIYASSLCDGLRLFT